MEITTEKDIIVWGRRVVRSYMTKPQFIDLKDYGTELGIWIREEPAGYGGRFISVNTVREESAFFKTLYKNRVLIKVGINHR